MASAAAEQKGRINLALLVAVLLIPAVLGSSQTIFNDGDVSWHIATGQWILDHRAIPVAFEHLQLDAMEVCGMATTVSAGQLARHDRANTNRLERAARERRFEIGLERRECDDRLVAERHPSTLSGGNAAGR